MFQNEKQGNCAVRKTDFASKLENLSRYSEAQHCSPLFSKSLETAKDMEK